MQSVHKKTALIILGILFISMASAQLVFEQSAQADIKIVCINAGYCSSSTVCNVSVFSPTENVLLDAVSATQTASLGFFNFTLNETQTSELGEYRVGGFCKDGSVTNIIDFTFQVTPSGSPPISNGQGFLLLGQFLLLISTFAFLIIGAIISTNLPVKVFLLSLAALILMTSFGFSSSLQDFVGYTTGSFWSGLYILFTTLILGGFFAVLLWLITSVLKAFHKSRGISDDDD